MTSIDLNCDLGERSEAVLDGTDEALMATLSSANVACGGHAGDDATMEASIRCALRHGVALGAHPGFPDRAGFGRVELPFTDEQIADTVHAQIRALAVIARRLGARIAHVKPHGALYNAAARGGSVAEAIARGVGRFDPRLPLFALAGSSAIALWESLGFEVVPEAFADRRYEPDGSLRARRHADALLVDPALAAEQAARIARGAGVVARDGSVVAVRARSLCVHGDTPGAVSIARAVRARLDAEGFRVRPTS